MIVIVGVVSIQKASATIQIASWKGIDGKHVVCYAGVVQAVLVE